MATPVKNIPLTVPFLRALVSPREPLKNRELQTENFIHNACAPRFRIYSANSES